MVALGMDVDEVVFEVDRCYACVWRKAVARSTACSISVRSNDGSEYNFNV